MLKSLRWRLQLWHALILLAVIVAFGGVLFLEVRRSRMDEIDAELLAAARVLEGTLRAMPKGIAKDGFKPPPSDREKFPFFPKDKKPFPIPPDRLERMLVLPHSLAERHADLQTPPYFLVWRGNGTLLKADPSEARSYYPTRPDLDARSPVSWGKPGHREILINGPEQALILVGRSIEREDAQARLFISQLILAGSAVFAVGLAGGWWLARQIFRPIHAMSLTAASINATNLSQRIDLADVDNELGRLGSILNDMFHRLEAAFERQVQFTADASHELRTPISVVLTNAELALAQTRSPEEYQQALGTCLRAAQRMHQLVQGLLTLARGDAGDLSKNHAPVALDALVEDCIDLLRKLAHERSIAMDAELSPTTIMGDAGALAQVVNNLISNAIRYNRPNGKVHVRLTTDTFAAILSVEDTGPGIPPEHRPHIFDRFYRVAEDRNRATGGTGLGLAISLAIVKAHGGTLELECGPQGGSTFRVILQRCVDDSAP